MANATNSVTIAPYVYIDDYGANVFHECRKEWQDALTAGGAGALTPFTNQTLSGTKPGHLRVVYVAHLQDTGKVLERAIPYNGTPPAVGATLGPVDGVHWKVRGHSGERLKRGGSINT
jgi:hypothetical protein